MNGLVLSEFLQLSGEEPCLSTQQRQFEGKPLITKSMRRRLDFAPIVFSSTSTFSTKNLTYPMFSDAWKSGMKMACSSPDLFD
jgi:hypothetical protein